MDHLNLSPAINKAITAAEAADEVNLARLAPGTILTFRTRNTLYRCERMSGGLWKVSGNPKFFKPEGTLTRIVGCTFGGSMIKVNHIFVRGHVEMVRNAEGGVIVTSMVTSIGDDPKGSKQAN